MITCPDKHHLKKGSDKFKIKRKNICWFGGIDDIEYLRNRMMAALKVPKAFVGYEEGVEGKATLAQEDIRFARTVERLQKIILSELTKTCYIYIK